MQLKESSTKSWSSHEPSFWSSSVQFSHSVMSDSLRPHGLQHTRLPLPSPTPRVCWNSCPSSWWCHLTISSSVVPFSSCPQSFPAPGYFPMSQFFAGPVESLFYQEWGEVPGLSGTLLPSVLAGSNSWEVCPEHTYSVTDSRVQTLSPRSIKLPQLEVCEAILMYRWL